MSAPGASDLLGHWTADAPLATLAAAALAYGAGVHRVRRWPARRSACFAAGLAIVAVALLSGVDAWAERLQSVHMVQHMLLAIVAPPLLVGGAPVTLALRAARAPSRRRMAGALGHPAARVVGHPATGFVAMSATLLGIHLTALYEAGATHAAIHAAEHAALLGAGVLFWMPLVAADRAPHRAGAIGRIGWALAAMAPMGALSAVLLSAAPRSTHYAASAAAAGVDPAADQRAAATVMWIGGGALITTAMLVLAGLALWEEEMRMRRREALSVR